MRRQYRFLNFKFFLFFLFLIILFFIIKQISSFLFNSDYFKIKNILSNQAHIDFLSYLKEENIFKLNLKEIADQINKKYPSYRIVRLSKQLPDTVIIELKKRQPIAYLRLIHYWGIDEEAVLIELKEVPQSSLPVIYGLDAKLSNLKLGQRIQLTEVSQALEFIKKIKSKKFLESYNLKKIYVANLKDMKFFIDGLEIRIGEDIDKGLKLLELLLPELKKDFPKIEYVDLRFKEPVVKYAK